MESKSTGRPYRVTISLPLAYSKPAGEPWPFDDLPERWPIVYVVDGNWYFAMVTEIVRTMSWLSGTTDAIVVGIGYPQSDDPVESWRDAFIRRDADLLPFRDQRLEQTHGERHRRPARTGDAGNFLNFIREELVPAVDGEYRTDSSRRIFVGHSYGGIFGLFSLFAAPGLFQSLIVGSPSLSLGNRDMFQREKRFAQDHTSLAANLYLYAGELEESATETTVTDTLRLAAILEGRRYAGLTVAKQIFRNQDHLDTVAPGAQWGLKLALRK